MTMLSEGYEDPDYDGHNRGWEYDTASGLSRTAEHQLVDRMAEILGFDKANRYSFENSQIHRSARELFSQVVLKHLPFQPTPQEFWKEAIELAKSKCDSANKP